MSMYVVWCSTTWYKGQPRGMSPKRLLDSHLAVLFNAWSCLAGKWMLKTRRDRKAYWSGMLLKLYLFSITKWFSWIETFDLFYVKVSCDEVLLVAKCFIGNRRRRWWNPSYLLTLNALALEHSPFFRSIQSPWFHEMTSTNIVWGREWCPCSHWLPLSRTCNLQLGLFFQSKTKLTFVKSLTV